MQPIANPSDSVRARFRWLVRVSVLTVLLAVGKVCPQGEVAAPASVPLSVAVIVHPDVSVDTLSRDDLLDYFTGDRQEWPDGTRVVIKEMKTRGDVRTSFYDFIGQRPSRLKSIWLRNMLSGEGERPESLTTPAEMLQCVADTPGSIGFVEATQIADGTAKTVLLIPSSRE